MCKTKHNMAAPNTKYIYLHKVDSNQNNNKFYSMKDNGDGTFTATYGREGANKPATEIYPSSKWEEKYKKKTSSRKGYIDITSYKSVISTNVAKDSSGRIISKDPEVVKLIQFLQNASNNLTKANYEVEAKSVTQAQIDDAQKELDTLFSSLKKFGQPYWTTDYFNKHLAKLFVIIPRKMKKVADHMINSTHTAKEIEEILQKEQDLLDSMASQVVTNSSQDEDKDALDSGKDTLLDTLGLKIETVTDKKILDIIKKEAQIHAGKINRVFAVKNINSAKRFDKVLSEASNKKTKLLWHGSRSANWMSILQTSLLIRPSNAAYTGSMFGDGIYFASEADKSWGYTDGGRWVGGNGNGKVYMALFNVHLGNQYKVDSAETNLTYQKIKNKGCDSTFAQKGRSLFRDEFIIYRPEQCTIEYLIEFNNK